MLLFVSGAAFIFKYIYERSFYLHFLSSHQDWGHLACDVIMHPEATLMMETAVYSQSGMSINCSLYS